MALCANEVCLLTSMSAESAVVDGTEDMSDFPEQRSPDLSELIYRPALTLWDATKPSERDTVLVVLQSLAAMQTFLAVRSIPPSRRGKMWTKVYFTWKGWYFFCNVHETAVFFTHCSNNNENSAAVHFYCLAYWWHFNRSIIASNRKLHCTARILSSLLIKKKSKIT